MRPWKCARLIHKTHGLPEGPDLLALKVKAKLAEIFCEIKDYLKDGILPCIFLLILILGSNDNIL